MGSTTEAISAPKPTRMDKLTAADIALAGTVGKEKDYEAGRPVQHPAGIIMTLVVSLCGSGLYAYGRAMGPLGFIPTIAIGIVTYVFASGSSTMVGKATASFSMPFDLALTEMLGTGWATLGNVIATAMLLGLLVAYFISLTNLWDSVIFSLFLEPGASFWAGLCVTAVINFLTTLIPDTAVLVKIASFSIVSICFAVIGLIFQAVAGTTPANAQCALDVLKNPGLAPAFSGSSLSAAAHVFALIGVFNASYFLHNSYETYFIAHPQPESRIRHLLIAMVLGTLVFWATGFAAMVPAGCDMAAIADNTSITIEGPVGIVAQVMFLIQITSVFPIVTAVVRSATVERLPWRRSAEGGHFGLRSLLALCRCRKEQAAVEIVEELVAAAESGDGSGDSDGELLSEMRPPPLTIAVVDTASASASAGEQLVSDSMDESLSTDVDKEEAGSFIPNESEFESEAEAETLAVDPHDPSVAAGLRLAAKEVDAAAEVRPPFLLVLITNIVIIGLCILMTALKVKITTVLSYSGAIAGWVYVYTLPPMFWLIKWKREGVRPVGKIVFAVCTMIFGLISCVGAFLPTE